MVFTFTSADAETWQFSRLSQFHHDNGKELPGASNRCLDLGMDLGTRNVSILDFVSSWLPAGPLRSKTGGVFVFGWGCQPGREPGNHHLCQASEGNTSSVVPQASNPSRS